MYALAIGHVKSVTCTTHAGSRKWTAKNSTKTGGNLVRIVVSLV